MKPSKFDLNEVNLDLEPSLKLFDTPDMSEYYIPFINNCGTYIRLVVRVHFGLNLRLDIIENKVWSTCFLELMHVISLEELTVCLGLILPFLYTLFKKIDLTTFERVSIALA